MTDPTSGRTELNQSRSNLLGLPILIGAALVAVVLREVLSSDPSTPALVVCGVVAVLDVMLTVYLLRNLESTLVVTHDEITFSRRKVGGFNDFEPEQIKRSPNSVLTFRTARNGPFGADFTGYILKLRDESSGQEVFAGAFGRNKVQQACESQGWTFASD